MLEVFWVLTTARDFEMVCIRLNVQAVATIQVADALSKAYLPLLTRDAARERGAHPTPVPPLLSGCG